MSNELLLLMATAASIGVVHTLLGPDHYVPFIVLAKARGWSLARTAGITVLCGLGHVLSSVVLGMAGIALGLAVHRLGVAEDGRQVRTEEAGAAEDQDGHREQLEPAGAAHQNRSGNTRATTR